MSGLEKWNEDDCSGWGLPFLQHHRILHFVKKNGTQMGGFDGERERWDEDERGDG